MSALVVVPSDWEVRQLEAAREALDSLRLTHGLRTSANTVLGATYDAMVSAGARSDFKLEGLPQSELREIFEKLGGTEAFTKEFGWLDFARAVEKAHGIDDPDEIPF